MFYISVDRYLMHYNISKPSEQRCETSVGWPIGTHSMTMCHHTAAIKHSVFLTCQRCCQESSGMLQHSWINKRPLCGGSSLKLPFCSMSQAKTCVLLAAHKCFPDFQIKMTEMFLIFRCWRIQVIGLHHSQFWAFLCVFFFFYFINHVQFRLKIQMNLSYCST